MTRAFFLLVVVGLVGNVAVAQPQPAKPVIEQIEDAWKVRGEKVKSAEVEFEVKSVFGRGALRDPSGKAVPENETATKYVAKFFLAEATIRMEKEGTGWDGKEFGQIRSVTVCSEQGVRGFRDLIGTTSVVTVTKGPNYFEAFADPFGPLTRHLRGNGPGPIVAFRLGDFQVISAPAVIRGVLCTTLEARSATGDVETLWLDGTRDWLVVRSQYGHNDRRSVICDFDYAVNDQIGHVLSKWNIRLLNAKRAPEASYDHTVLRTVLNKGTQELSREIAFPVGARVLDETWNPKIVGIVQPDGSYAPAPGTDPVHVREGTVRADPWWRNRIVWFLSAVTVFLAVASWWLRWRKTPRATLPPTS